MHHCQSLGAFITYVYLQLLCVVNAQYITIWDDNFNTRNGAWSCNQGYFSSASNGGGVSDWTANACFLPYSSSSACDSNPCALLCSIGSGTNDWSIQRSMNIDGYSALQLQFYATVYDLGSTETCQVWYKYNTGSWIKPWEHGDVNGEVTYSNQLINLGAIGSATSVTIKLQISAANAPDCDEACYFDSLKLRGIPVTDEPSATPTPSPTDNPTPAPTDIPTDIPTHNPSNHPTYTPTQISSANPTATFVPTKTPTTLPTFSPTKLPTNSPTNALLTTTKLAVTNEPVIEQQNHNLLDSISLPIVMILILLFVCISCLLLLVMVKCFKHKNRGNNDAKQLQTNEMNAIEMQRIQSSSEAAEPGPGTFDLQAWLKNIGLFEYYAIFVMNGFGDTGHTDAQIYSLNNADLKEMGISKIGHRKVILLQIKDDQEKLWKQHKMNQNYEAKQGNEHEGAANGLNGIRVTTNGGDDDDANEESEESSVHYTTADATAGWAITANVNGYD